MTLILFHKATIQCVQFKLTHSAAEAAAFSSYKPLNHFIHQITFSHQ